MKSYDESRKFNSQHNVNGVFVVYKNIVLQVLEGEATAVANAAYRIRRDSQFERCSIIVNCDIAAPYFNTWFIRLVKPGVKTPQAFLANLKKVLEKDFVFESPKDRKLYEDIFIAERNQLSDPPAAQPIPINTAATRPNPVELNPVIPRANHSASTNIIPTSHDRHPLQGELQQSSEFAGYALSISAWPNPHKVRLTPKEMKTCSLLSHRFVSYNEIIDRGIWSSELELIEFLKKLQDAGSLQLRADPSDFTNHRNSTQNTVPVKADRFSQLLKKFIATPKKQVN